MSYIRDGENITLAMTLDEYEQLLFIIGYAVGGRRAEEDYGTFYKWLAFVNHLNVGNRDFTPYEIPEEFRGPGVS